MDLRKIATLAALHNLGTVGLAGYHAAGLAADGDPVEVFVSVPLAEVDAFGFALCEALRARVRVYDCRRLGWEHPLHLCVKWFGDDLPVIECPRRAFTNWRVPRANIETRVSLSEIPHFKPVDFPRPFPRGEILRTYGPPPIGFEML